MISIGDKNLLIAAFLGWKYSKPGDYGPNECWYRDQLEGCHVLTRPPNYFIDRTVTPEMWEELTIHHKFNEWSTKLVELVIKEYGQSEEGLDISDVSSACGMCGYCAQTHPRIHAEAFGLTFKLW